MAGRKCKCERCGAVGYWNHISADVFLDYEAEFRIRRKDGKKANFCVDCLKVVLEVFESAIIDNDKVIVKERKW